jgi:glutamate-ammonia-ligase adenylyltransferase
MEEGAKPANLKRGPGGIVDIEFIAQMLQVVYGGADASLRTPETRVAIAALHRSGHLDREECAFLDSAYRTLRRIECRLRLIGAAARHDFPAGDEERRRLAHLMGHHDPDGLAAEVAAVTARTRLTFEAIFDRTVASISGS